MLNDRRLRVLVTVGVVAATVLAGRLPLPGIDQELLRQYSLGGFDGAGFSAVAIGLVPWTTATVLVEVGALTRERWRRLRVGGPDGRAALERTVRTVWLLVCVVQAFAMAVSMESMRIGFSSLVLDPGGQFRVVTVLTLTAGSALFGLAVGLIHRWGFGNGFAILVGAPYLYAVASGLAVPDLLQDEHRSAVAPLVVALVAVGFGTRRFLRGSISVLPASAAGVVPATMGVSWGVLAQVVAPERTGIWLAVAAGVAVVATPVWVWLFNRPAMVARATGRPVELARAALPPAVALGIAVSLLLVLGDARAPHLAFTPYLQPVALVTVLAIVWDLHAEWVARGELGTVVPVWPFHRVHEVAPAVAALRAAGITAHVRGLRVRLLYHFFLPYVPIEILVAPDRAGDARKVLAERPVP